MDINENEAAAMQSNHIYNEANDCFIEFARRSPRIEKKALNK